MAIYELDGKAPQLGTGAWVADSAQVIGQVELGENASVWYGTVIRGDVEKIRIGRNSNVQDLSVLHADFGVPLVIGDNVTIGHQVMLHGCTIGDGTLIGIQAVVLNNAKIGRNCVVGAGAVVTEGKEFPDNSLIVGAPAKAIRTLDEAAIAGFAQLAPHYVENAKMHGTRLKKDRLMSELHKFLFDGLPVRGMIVRLTDAWVEILRRRRSDDAAQLWPWPVAEMLGEMAAAGVLMQANIKFNGALILQIFGEGPVKVAVAEVQQDLSLRVTAKVVGDVAADAQLQDLVNVNGRGRCAITLDPKERLPGQQAYQGVVPLNASNGPAQPRLSDVIEHYMRQSEQLDTRLVLAASETVAAGLLIQRLPAEGEGNLGGQKMDFEEQQEHFNRIATLAGSLTSEELLQLDVETILRRLFWQEKLMRFDVQTPRFACTCSRERVAGMIRGLGQEEAESILSERPEIDVSCDFCGSHYRFDPVDAAQIFMPPGDKPPGPTTVQ